MKQPRKPLLFLLISLALAAIAASWWSISRAHEEKHILVVFSHDPQMHGYKEIEEAIRRNFSSHRIPAEFTISYLQAENYGHDEEIRQCKRILREAREKKEVDLIINIGDEANYSMMYADSVFMHQVPVVFGGVLFPNQGAMKSHPNMTGYRDSVDVVRNIYLSHQLTGNYATFTVLAERYLDGLLKNTIKTQLASHQDIVDNTDWDYTLYHIRNLPKGTYSITRFSLNNINTNSADRHAKNDSLGNNNFIYAMRRFVAMTYLQMKYDEEALTVTHMSRKVMLSGIFNNFGGEAGEFLAGYFASPTTIANDVSNVAIDILRGAKPEDIPIRTSAKDYYIDWQVAKQNGYRLDTLPEGFKVVNLTWKERHHHLYLLMNVLGTLAVIGTVIVFLRLFWKEKKLRQETLKLLEHENALYNMSVHDSQTFAWERVGENIYLSNAFWDYFGKPAGHIQVDEFTRMLAPEYTDAYLNALKEVNTGKMASVEVQADFNGDGQCHWYKIMGNGIIDGEGQFVKAYGMLTNIDDFKMRERELNEARKLAEEATLKESFLANMSHEIRTPLNAIVGFSDLLASSDDLGPEDKQLFIETIHTNNELLLKLINDILDVSRIESGEMDFCIKPCSVANLMEKIHNTFMVQIPSHLEFKFVCPEKDVEIEVDEGRLSQVISNFLTNAGKFTPQGSITLGWEWHEDTDKVEMYVEDTGIGLSEEDRKMVFNRFYKKDEFKQGTGLGLSICKAIIIRLGGSIKVKSELGTGSRFSVFLKRKQEGKIMNT